MTDQEQREAARKFINRWKGRGNEDEDGRSYWIELLHDVLGMENVTERVDFEKKVYVDGNKKRIDVYIPETHVLIEQKSLGKALDQKIHNSGGIDLTPYEQAKRYADNLGYYEDARWIVTSNFSEIWIYNMAEKNAGKTLEPTKINLIELQDKFPLLDFMIKREVKEVSHEEKVSIEAGNIVGKLYDALLSQYKDPEDKNSLKSLNMLCVRLVFCLYAEDAGIFGKRNMFHDYLEPFDAKYMRTALIDLFRVLDQKSEERDPYLVPELAAFPYVNGGLFREENIEIPMFTDEIRSLILKDASENFDWSGISPTIFGAVFESTLNQETRRSGGMHYTSVENIHKVIDPLFLDDLKKEFHGIEQFTVMKTKKYRLDDFQTKLASLHFLDPAAGSGNFLTETYLSLRRLENEVIKEKIALQKGVSRGQIIMGEAINPIKVSITQFYGIEINDFAVSVAKTALWIAESQMMKETEDIVHMSFDFLPLTTNASIIEANALRIDWNDVIPAKKLDYIMGNPPFVGSSRLKEPQKKDRERIFGDAGGELDYVACWYKKAAEFTTNTEIKCAFVSTNSICQGQQVYPLWKPLMTAGIKIDFAYTTFVWDSEASVKANVFCVIIGFSHSGNANPVLIDDGETKSVKHINAYLVGAQDIYVKKKRKPFGAVPLVIKGFQPTDHGNLILDDEQKAYLLKEDPSAERWIRPFITAREFIHGKNRWCLWLPNMSPAELNNHPLIKQRVQQCYEWRIQQTKTGDAYKLKDRPMLMRPSKKFSESDFIVLPRHSGERRKYVPFGFMKKGCIPGDSVSIIPNAPLVLFGILESNVHMAWMKTVCGRLKGDYRYSSDIVYNTFPWPSPSDAEKARIEQTAQKILDVRELYPDCSLAELYDKLTMPPELLKAHQANDRAVMAAYGFSTKMSEPDCVGELMKMYQKLTSKK